jgi:cytochrome c biogenesis protein CcmG/thiol:disulfide interchange protein DsbE
MNHKSRKRLARAALALSLTALLVLAWTQRDRFIPVGVGTRAPSYSAETLDGQPVSLASLSGKVVLLNVWATWCAPCRIEMPALQRLHKQLQSQGLEVVAVSVDTPPGMLSPTGQFGGDVKAYVDAMGLSFTVLHDPARSIEELFLVQGLPTTFIIDKQGRIQHKVIGARAWDDAVYVNYLKELLRS